MENDWPSGHQLPRIKLPLKAVPKISSSITIVEDTTSKVFEVSVEAYGPNN